VSTWEVWLYVAFVLDVHSRMIVGWQIPGHLRTDLVLDALKMASSAGTSPSACSCTSAV
jgi:putative transposase